jgi:hypothetical protein
MSIQEQHTTGARSLGFDKSLYYFLFRHVWWNKQFFILRKQGIIFERKIRNLRILN